jgi:transcriptional regulator with XRE-family HTH domain
MPNSTPPVRTRRVPQPQDPAIAALRVDHERVYQAIDQRRRQQRLRWNEIAAMLGVSSPAVTGWGHGTGLSATHLARALAWLGRPLSDFTTAEVVKPGPEAQHDAA